MNKKVRASQKSHDEIKFDQMPILVPPAKALIPFSEMDRPNELKRPRRADEEELRDPLEERARQRRLESPGDLLVL